MRSAARCFARQSCVSRREVAAGEALLVCAYENEAQCDRIKLEGAISLTEFRTLAESLPKDKEIIFYCA